MMFHFPYFGMPYYSRYSRYGYRYPYYTYNPKYNAQTSKNSNVDNKKNTNSYSNLNKNNSGECKNTKQVEYSNSNDDAPIFQLFGINLYFDDIMLIFLIWFLYEEGVKDEGLFIALILLLLS